MKAAACSQKHRGRSDARHEIRGHGRNRRAGDEVGKAVAVTRGGRKRLEPKSLAPLGGIWGCRVRDVDGKCRRGAGQFEREFF